MTVNENSSVHCQSCPAWKNSAFSMLSTAELDSLQKQKSCFEKSRGDHLNKKGMPVDGAYCMAAGHVKVTWPESNGRESIVKIVSPGDMAGYRCLFSEETFRATAVALNSVRGCFIPKEQFHHLLTSHPKFNAEMFRRMGKELRLAESRLHAFCQKNVRERMAQALLILKDSCGVESEGKWLLDIQLTREEISSWIGSAKETVVRTLTDMKEEKVIELEGSVITLLDVEALKKIAGLPF